MARFRQSTFRDVLFAVEKHGDALVLIPRCDLVLLTRENFIEALEAVGGSTSGRVIVSLVHCDHVGFPELGAIARASKKIGRRLALVISPRARLARVLPITEFKKIVSIYPSLSDALADSMGPSASERA